MIKTYVLDTNVLIQAPDAIERFEEHRVVLPLAVLEELDHLKNADGEKRSQCKGGNSFIRTAETEWGLTEGVELPSGAD